MCRSDCDADQYGHGLFIKGSNDSYLEVFPSTDTYIHVVGYKENSLLNKEYYVTPLRSTSSMGTCHRSNYFPLQRVEGWFSRAHEPGSARAHDPVQVSRSRSDATTEEGRDKKEGYKHRFYSAFK